jgi:hypothetical protein
MWIDRPANSSRCCHSTCAWSAVSAAGHVAAHAEKGQAGHDGHITPTRFTAPIQCLKTLSFENREAFEIAHGCATGGGGLEGRI